MGEWVTINYWKKYQHEWPELAAYAKALLTVPASSASVEWEKI